MDWEHEVLLFHRSHAGRCPWKDNQLQFRWDCTGGAGLWVGWIQNHMSLPELCRNSLRSMHLCIWQTANIPCIPMKPRLLYTSGTWRKSAALNPVVSKVPLRKKTKKKVRGLTRDAVKVLLAEPDTTRKTGIRDLTLMVVLYATAARIDEILSIKVTDLHLDAENERWRHRG